MTRISELWRYPLKSAAGHAVPTLGVDPWGLAGDRRWAVLDPADDDGLVVTAREEHRLLLVRPEPTATGLRLHAPGRAPLEVTTPTAGVGLRPVRVWRSRIVAADAGDEAAAWLGAALGRTVRLVHLDDPMRRATNPAYSEETDRVSLADGYPILLTTTASLAALNDAVLEGAGPDGAPESWPLPMTRFRPNVVVDHGAEGAPWVEDDWRRVRLGTHTFRVVKGCERCVMTTLQPDHERGVVDRGPEPIRTMARIRRFDGGTWFGVNLIPDPLPAGAPPVALAVGDDVEVLAAVPAGGGPPR